MFLAFSLANVVRATTACTFSTSQLPKVVRTWCVLYILTWKYASRHSDVQFFISHLASWLHTRRFSEPTFRPAFRDFLTFSRTWIFFLLRLSFSSSLLFSDSSHLCFSSVHIVGSLTSKLPSVKLRVIFNSWFATWFQDVSSVISSILDHGWFVALTMRCFAIPANILIVTGGWLVVIESSTIKTHGSPVSCWVAILVLLGTIAVKVLNTADCRIWFAENTDANSYFPTFLLKVGLPATLCSKVPYFCLIPHVFSGFQPNFSANYRRIPLASRFSRPKIHHESRSFPRDMPRLP